MDKPYRRKDSPYWWIKLPPIRGESRPLQKSTGTTDKRKAQEYLDKLKAQRWDEDKFSVKPRYRWEEAANRWLGETQHKKSHQGDHHILRWLHPYLGGKDLQDIDRALIDKIKQDRLKVASPSRANRYLATIRTILRRARDEWEMVSHIPAIRLFPEPKGRVRALTPEEFGRLYRELPEHLADMALFAVSTGLRQGNIKRLRWSNVDLVNRHAWVNAEEHKNGSAHAVPLNAPAMSVLEKRQGVHPVFVFTYQGGPLEQVGTRAWREALVRADIRDFRWHDLRHTWATWQRRAGSPTWEIQRLGGWKTQIMVERYAHLAPDALQLAAQRLDNVLGSYSLATPEGRGMHL
jgi:integrase